MKFECSVVRRSIQTSPLRPVHKDRPGSVQPSLAQVDLDLGTGINGERKLFS